MSINVKGALVRAQEALNLREPEPVKSSYITGRLWSDFTGRLDRTASESHVAIKFFAKAIVAAATLAPYILATVGTILADVVVMTAKGISNAFSAIRNRFSKPAEQGNLDKAIDFVKTNKKAIAVGSGVLVTLAAAGGAYYFRAEISDAASKGYDKAAEYARAAGEYLGLIEKPAEKEWYNFWS